MLLLFPMCMLAPSLMTGAPAVSRGTVFESASTGVGEAEQRDVELDMMLFAPSAPNEDGICYVARRGADVIAYFGDSEVYYVVGDASFRLDFPGSVSVAPVGEESTGSVTNYILGNDPSKWKAGLKDCAILRYADLYPGIDLVYRFLDRNLKYEFVVAPHADPSLIQMRYSDADAVDVNDVSVVAVKNGGAVTDAGLMAFQEGNKLVDGECVFQAHDGNIIGFSTGRYDTSRELVIDPLLLTYSTFLGGSASDGGMMIAVEDGFVYVTGLAYSFDFPTANPYDSALLGDYDCFVTKFAADGQFLIYSTFLGGSDIEIGVGITVENGLAYVSGQTTSTDFPTVNAMDSSLDGASDSFVTKFAGDGQSLIYSTFLGGSVNDEIGRIAVEDGSIYVTGATSSSDFPTTSAYDSTLNGDYDCFVTKFAPDGQSLVYSTFVGGSGYDEGFGIAVETGLAYVSGTTQSSGFPTVYAADSTLNGTSDCFVTKLAADGRSLIYSSLLGGSSDEEAAGIAVENGFAYVTGNTLSSDFPVGNAFDSAFDGLTDCFVTKFALDGSSLVYSTFLGGSLTEMGYEIAVENGLAHVTGETFSSDFPTTRAYNSTYGGNTDCFVTRLAADGQSLVYSTFLGGASYDAPQGIAEENGFVYVTGFTESPDFPTVNAFDSTINGPDNCFVAVMYDDTDTDMDGLDDWTEARYGTNPHCIDSDNDNFLDGYEVAYGSNATDPMSYPAMPQAWYDAIYHDLDGNATLIQYLIAWADGNATLMETVMQQLDANATLLQQVITWLDGNHTAIEALFHYVDGNATLLAQTVNGLNGNSSLIQNLIGWADGNTTLLRTVMQQLETNATLLRQVISWLDGNHTAIEELFLYVSGNATLLMQVVNAVDGNEADIALLAALVADDIDRLVALNTTHIEDIASIWAVLNMLGVTVGDTDYDGLNDLQEIALGTNPQCIDTDCDNLNDAYEVKIGTDPTDDDTDNDTYYDGAEVLAGTDPLDPLDYPSSSTTTTTAVTTTVTTTPTTTTTQPSTLAELIIIVGAMGCVGLVVLLFLTRKRADAR